MNDLLFSIEEIALYCLMFLCFAIPAFLTTVNVCNLIFPKKLIPRASVMLTIIVGGILYSIMLLVYFELYPDAIGGFSLLFPVFGVLALFILFTALWNYPEERLTPTVVRTFRTAFIAANLAHLAFAAVLAPFTVNIFLMLYVYHINLVLVSAGAVINIRK